MKVVHCKKSDYDIYIGRGRCPKTGIYSIWGNPFIIGKHGDRKEVIAKYEEWIKGQPNLLNQLHTLYGKILGCWCSPQECHGDILIKLVNRHVEKQFADYFYNYNIFCEQCNTEIKVNEENEQYCACKNNDVKISKNKKYIAWALNGSGDYL